MQLFISNSILFVSKAEVEVDMNSLKNESNLQRIFSAATFFMISERLCRF